PPQPTDEVIAFGYDEAFQKETVQSDGTVNFYFGEVPSETNGDIRIAYNVGLFSGATYLTSDEPMRNEILNAKNELLDKAKEWEHTQETLVKISWVLIPIFILTFIVIIIRHRMEGRGKLTVVKRELTKPGVLPKQELSIPATIYYTSPSYVPKGETMAAALLDLVRKKMVKQVSEEKFQLV